MRTIVISDIHGYPELIETALEHVGFRPGEDRFIFAGDFLDGGPGAARAFELIEELADVILLGNHELAAMFHMEISPQEPDAFDYSERLVDRVLDYDGRWKLACAEQGVLVTHAGVSDLFAPEWAAAGDDVTRFAAALNSELRVLLGRLALGTFDEDELEPLLGPDGPLWWRPFMYGNAAPLTGLKQVCGHTPRELYTDEGLRALEVLDIHLVAPLVHERDPRPVAGRYRYGVIEDGEVTVESGERG